jgi:rod shape-determining protein MreD
MIRLILYYLWRFLALVLVQVLVLNQVQLGSFINPFLYLYFLLILPVQTPKLLLLPLAFLIGIAIDMFQNTPGIHASASLVLVYIRPKWLTILSPREGYETDATPSIHRFGLAWFITYAAILVIAHHFILFFLEIFRFTEILSTLYRILLSSGVTLLLIIMLQYLGVKPKNA